MPSTAVTGATAIGSEKPWVKVRVSNGGLYEVHPGDYEVLMRRDPGAKVLQ